MTSSDETEAGAPDGADRGPDPSEADADPSDGQPRVPRPLLVLAVAVGVVVVVLAGVALWRTARDDEAATASGEEAADAFVEAYTRHLDATFRVEGELTRTLEDGRTLSSAYLTVQRPPDHVQRSLGSTSGVVNGRTVNCSTPDGGAYTCAATGTPVDAEEERQTTLDALESYVRGDDPLYAVTVDDEGCFALVRRRTVIEATYGRRARLCFDPTTSALRRLEVVREGGATDVLLAEIITSEVTDADFDLSEDDTYDPEVPDPPEESGTSVPTTTP